MSRKEVKERIEKCGNLCYSMGTAAGGLRRELSDTEGKPGTVFGDDMIDFDEELKKYTPNMEISEAEEAVLSREITDAADVIERILQERKELK